jgi:putative hemolysin
MKPHPAESKAPRSGRYMAGIAACRETVQATQALRYRIFAQEMGAKLHSRSNGLDDEEIDDYCDHLFVRDLKTGNIVACSRLLPDTAAKRLGRFYSEGEFHLDGVLALPGRFLEIGRTCVDPVHRGSVVLGTLWNGLAEYVHQHRFDYLMGCASISPGPSGFAVDAVYRRISLDQFGPESLNVRPRQPVPRSLRCQRDESGIPPLLQAYLRLGCWICGDPCWDEDFNVMDVFVLLDLARLQERYEKRFIAPRVQEVPHGVMPALV